MSDERRKRSMLSSKLFWIFVYVVVYIGLRYTGDIAAQQIALPAPNGAVEVFRMIGPHPDIPQWRQQTWRALFSFAMVAEEEGKKILDNHNGNSNNSQRGPSGMPPAQPSQNGPGLAEKAGEIWQKGVQYFNDLVSNKGR